MGKVVSKLTGADKQAKAMEEAARQQAAATRDSAARASKAAQESAAQAARQQEASAARNAAEGAASDALARPAEEADVQLAGVDTGASASGAARKRRQTFGLGSGGTGVNI